MPFLTPQDLQELAALWFQRGYENAAGDVVRCPPMRRLVRIEFFRQWLLHRR